MKKIVFVVIAAVCIAALAACGGMDLSDADAATLDDDVRVTINAAVVEGMTSGEEAISKALLSGFSAKSPLDDGGEYTIPGATIDFVITDGTGDFTHNVKATITFNGFGNPFLLVIESGVQYVELDIVWNDGENKLVEGQPCNISYETTTPLKVRQGGNTYTYSCDITITNAVQGNVPPFTFDEGTSITGHFTIDGNTYNL